MQAHPLRELVQRDRPVSIDYLSKVAEPMVQQGVIADRLINNFRLQIRDLQQNRDAGDIADASLLIRLIQEDSPFLAALRFRLGDYALFVNLLRFSLRSPLAHLQQSLSNSATSLIKKAELLFNRSFYLYQNGKCEAQVLMSSFLVDIADELAEAAENVEMITNHLNQLSPAQIHQPQSEDHQIEQGLMTSLDFRGVRPEVLSFRRENQTLRQLTVTLQQLMQTLGQAFHQSRLNQLNQNDWALQLHIDHLSATTQHWQSLTFSPEMELNGWESRRLLWLESLQRMQNLIDQLLTDFVASLRPAAQPQDHFAATLPNSMQRRLIGYFISRGAHPHEAAEATEKLLDYCAQAQLRPGELVAGELKKVHTLLTDQSLQLLQEMDIDRDLAQRASEEKKSVLDRSAQLLSRLKGTKTSLLGCLLLLVACGFKTKPVSDIDDLRPEIPYQQAAAAQPAEPPQTADKDENSAKDEQPSTQEQPSEAPSPHQQDQESL
jgi:hypothetical protein